MRNTIPFEVLHICAAHGGTENVPAPVLESKGYRRIKNRNGNVFLVETREYDRLPEMATVALEECHGYLYAGDAQRLYDMSLQSDYVAPEEVRKMVERASAFKGAGVPPIFLPQFYGQVNRPDGSIDLFPVVDFIVQFGANTYIPRMKSVARTPGRIVGGAKVAKATLEEVFQFRRNVFVGRKIDKAFMRETAWYVAEHFRFGDDSRRRDALERDRLVFLFLEEVLADLSGYEDWPSAMYRWSPSRTVGATRWSAGMSEEERNGKIRLFLASISPRPTRPQREILEKLEVIFPEQVEGARDDLSCRLRALRAEQAAELWGKIRGAEASRDFLGIPEVCFVEEPWAEVLIPMMERFLEKECVLLGDRPELLFGSADKLAPFLKVPLGIPLVPRFKDAIDRARLAVAPDLDDDTFRQLFAGVGGRRAALAHLKSGGRRSIGDELVEYLSLRLEEMGE